MTLWPLQGTLSLLNGRSLLASFIGALISTKSEA